MRFLRNLAIGLFVIAVAAFVLLTSSEPKFVAVPPQPASMALVKNAAQPLRNRADVTAPATIRLSNKELEAASSLAAQALAPAVVSSSLTEDAWLSGVSYPLPLGRWLNIEASVAKLDYKSAAGELPPFKVKMGSVTLPSFLSKPLFNMVLRQVQKRYSDVPNPDQVLKALHFSQDAVDVTVQVPRSGTLLKKAADWTGRGVDDQLVKRALCHLATAQRTSPSSSLEDHIQRAFSAEAVGSSGAVESRNRASLVALAVYVGGPRAQRVFYTSGMQDARCAVPADADIRLAGRSDLAKHWAVSAAMAATLGVNVSGAVGEWKELSDSLPQGTGFSFVDIAADRSGFRYGAAAANPESAQYVHDRLAKATDAALLPPSVIKLEENMSDKRFAEAYSNLNSPEYKQMIAQIEQEFDRSGVPK